MTYVLEKWDSVAGDWDEISEYSEKIDPDMHMDIFDVREIQYGGNFLTLDEDADIEHNDYLRYRTDDSPSNYRNIVKGNDSDMGHASDHNWVAGLGTPSFDIDTTVAGKMFFDCYISASEEIELDLPKTMTPGVTYRIKVKVRLNSGGGTMTIRFGDGVGSASGTHFEFTPTGTEIQYEGTFTPAGSTFKISVSSANNDGSDFEIDDLELYVESDPVIISGYVGDLIQKIRAKKFEFDLCNEITHLKNQDIGSKSLNGSTLRERLMDALPSGYVLVEMNSVAETMLALDNTDVPGITSMTYPGHEIQGTDSYVYTCKQSHISAAATRPVTGGSWTDYWEYKGSGTSETWENAVRYYAKKFNDILFDTLLIANSNSFGANILYCVVLNKELRMFGKTITDSGTGLTAALLSEIEKDLTQENIEIKYFDLINDDLRGEGTLTWGLNLTGEWKVRIHKIYSTEEFDFMTTLNYDSYDYGFITGVEKSGSMFKYEVTEHERIV